MHIRRINPRRDLNVVADLIESSFELKHDPEGQVIIRQMRAQASRQRYEPSLVLLPGSPYGFVWEEDDTVVGNISLIPFSAGLKRIVLIANVAVAPAYRRKGIAAALTRHALRYIQQMPGSETWLQVRADNRTAISLYAGLGFRRVSTITQWKHAPVSTPYLLQPPRFSPTAAFTRRRLSDWKNQSAWLESAYPTQTRWYQNLPFACFSPLAWFNPACWDALGDLSHLALRQSDQLAGMLTWHKNKLSSDQVWLALPPSEGEAADIAQLLSYFLFTHKPQKPLALEYPFGRAAAGFEQAGFSINRHLDWMKFHPA